MIEMVSTFKERFALALSLRNIKAIEISEKTGISESTLSQYKGGYSKPKDKRLFKIAEVLNVSPEWLLGLNVPMDEEERAKQIRDAYVNDTLSSDDRELLDLYHIASPEAKAMVDFALKRNQQKP